MARVDREIDFHGWTRAAMREELNHIWSRREWHGLRRVRVIHGTGLVLWRVLDEWCEEKGIPYAREEHRGSTIIFPGQRRLPNTPTRNYPLTPLRGWSPPPKPRQIPRPQPTPEEPEDTDLFNQAMEDLEKQDRRTLLRKKHGGGA